jgi:hypothetical protein
LACSESPSQKKGSLKHLNVENPESGRIPLDLPHLQMSLFILVLILGSAFAAPRPHIVFFMADDLVRSVVCSDISAASADLAVRLIER